MCWLCGERIKWVYVARQSFEIVRIRLTAKMEREGRIGKTALCAPCVDILAETA